MESGEAELPFGDQNGDAARSFEDAETVIVGLSCEADSGFDPCGHREELERRSGPGFRELLQEIEAIHGRGRDKKDAEHAPGAHIVRVSRHALKGVARGFYTWRCWAWLYAGRNPWWHIAERFCRGSISGAEPGSMSDRSRPCHS